MLGIAVFLLATSYSLAVPVSTLPEESDYRLPTNVVPVSYDITIIPTFPSDESATESWFNGNVKIVVTASNETVEASKITLHAYDMEITDVLIHLPNSTMKVNPDLSDMAKYHFIHLDLDDFVLTDSEQITIEINYEGNMRSDMNGFYLSKYKDAKNRTQWIGTTQFEPVHARRAFPCFDEPSFKAKFTITIQHPEGYTTLSNTNIDQSSSMKNIDVYQPSPVMSSYLVAFVVSKFVNVGEGSFNVHVRAEAKKQAKFAQSIQKKLTDEMGSFVGLKYEKLGINKMDMIALPDFSAGAMENWGLLTYRETALLWDETESTTKDKQRVASVVAHEISHQWFGDYVTLHWWEDTWLNEGFATYFEYHLTDKVEPDMHMPSQFVVEEVQTAMAADSFETAQPLTNPVSTPNEISAMFGQISYNKGGSVIRMIEHLLTTEKFKIALNAYLQKNQYSVSHPSDLWEKMNSIKPNIMKDISMEDLMENWFNEPGYPIVYAKLDKEKVTLSQKKFVFPTDAKEKMSTKNDTKWYIPISRAIYSKGKLNFDTTVQILMKPEDKGVSFKLEKDELPILNVKATGYYRVNYDKDLRKMILKALNDEEKLNTIDVLNRAQMIDDILNLARAGEVPYSDAFEFLDYLKKETEYYPWYAAFEGFRFLLQRYPDKDVIGQNLRAYILDKMSNMTHNYLSDTYETENHIDVLNRVNILQWACDLNDENCIKNAQKKFNKTSVPADERIYVYCTAIRAGDSDTWETLWEMFGKTNVAAEKVTILGALGCSRDNAILENYLQMSIDPSSGIRKQDAMYVFTSVYTGNYQGVDVAFKFLETNFKAIADNYGGMNALGNAIAGLSSRLTSEEQVKKLETFLKNNAASLKDVEATGKNSLAMAKSNRHWVNTFNKQMADIFEPKHKNSATMAHASALSLGLAVYLLFRQVF